MCEQDNDVWLTQASIAKLFGVDRSVITKHLKTVFEDGEVEKSLVCANFAQTADDGKTYNYKFYGLKAVIAVGYKVNSQAAIEFRQWATRVLETFAKQGYVLDKQRIILFLKFRKSVQANENFIRKTLIFTQLPTIIHPIVRRRRIFLLQFKTRCTMQFMEIQLPK